MRSGFLMGIDIGTASSKGVIVGKDGGIIARSSIPHKISMLHPGWLEHDADRVWLHDFLFLTKDLLKKSGLDPKRILALGVSSICSALLLLDKDRKPLRPAILYGVDTRASLEVEEIKRDLGTHVTNQNITPKLRWVQKHEPEIWDKTHHLFSGHHYIVMKLTGRICQNRNDLHNYYPLIDDRIDHWLLENFKYFDVNTDILPEIIWTTDIAGRITKEGAELSGLAVGMPVIAGTNDAAAEALSAGVVAPGDMMMMYGSSHIYDLVVDRYVRSEKYLTRRLNIPHRFGLGGGLATAGSLTAWFKNLFGGKEMYAEQQGGPNAYQSLAQLAEQSAIGANGLILLPYFSGARNPIFDGDALGTWFGLNLTHTRADMYRAVLEAIGFGIRHCLEQFEDDDLSAQEIYAIGGGVRNPVWMQIVSDICNIRQHIPVEKIGACYGDAFLAGYGIGLFENMTDIKKWVHIQTTIHPHPESHAAYKPYYRIYRELYPANKELMHRLSVIQKNTH
jgi:xylulokinase